MIYLRFCSVRQADFYSEIVRTWIAGRWTLFLGCIVYGLLSCSAAMGNTPSENIAVGCRYKISPAPNYALTTGDSDATDLTDGEKGTGRLWVNENAVAWRRIREKPIDITLDLGESKAIDGVAVHGAAGVSGGVWPRSITVLFSPDGKNYHFGAELTTASDQLPVAYGELSDHTFSVSELNVSARYVRIIMAAAGMYTCIDEIEVFAGDSSSAKLLDGPGVELENFASPVYFTKVGIQQRLLRDLQTVEQELANSNISDAEQAEIQRRIHQLRVQTRELPLSPIWGFRAILPLNALHREVFEIHARLLRAAGYAPLTVWHTHRYAPLDPFAFPVSNEPNLDIDMACGEHRPVVFNLTNASAEPQIVNLQIAESSESLPPASVQVLQAQFLDTREGSVVCDPLTPVQNISTGHYQLAIPAGMTAQVWLSINGDPKTPGKHCGVVRLQTNQYAKELPFIWNIVDIQLPASDPTLTVWDYAANMGRAFTEANRLEGIRDMRNLGVNAPWASRKSVPWPKPDDFDSEGHLTGSLDYGSFDAFVQIWPDARHYMFFLATEREKEFAGFAEGTAEFDRAVGEWAKAWGEHIEQMGLRPGQVMLISVDEPRNAGMWLSTLNWSKAIKQSTDMFAIFVDPVRPHPPAIEYAKEAIRYCDVICPPTDHYEESSPEIQAFYKEIPQAEGKQLWLYSCDGPVRLQSLSYFRLQAWRGFETGATGFGFWAYADTGGAVSNWNPYYALGDKDYSPVLIDEKSITHSKCREAIREGVADYAYLIALAQHGEAQAAMDQATALLDRSKQAYGSWGMYFDPGAVDVYEWIDQAKRAVFHKLMATTTKTASPVIHPEESPDKDNAVAH